MSCRTNHSGGNFCGCHAGGMYHPAMWSKTKKEKVLNDYLQCLEEQIEEVKEALKEL